MPLVLTPDEQKLVDKIKRNRELMRKPKASKALLKEQIKRWTKILMTSYYKGHPDFPSLHRGNQGHS